MAFKSTAHQVHASILEIEKHIDGIETNIENIVNIVEDKELNAYASFHIGKYGDTFSILRNWLENHISGLSHLKKKEKE